MKSRPVGLESAMWAQPVKQGELKKKGQKGSSFTLHIIFSISRPRGSPRQELEDSLVHPSVGHALLLQEENRACADAKIPEI